jgi:predicted Zn-dependent protease
LVKGSTGSIASDINYTLIVFPNHPRALLAMSKLSLKTKEPRPKGARFSIDCYFDRAIRWAPDDPQVRLVYAIHLIHSGQKDAARVQLETAERNPIDEANFQYNLGIAFLDVDDADRALTHAWRAYGLGYDLPGLRIRLEKLGKWREPEK